MVETETPEFVDGVPANLAAAALDALEWLRFFEKRAATSAQLNQENATRLACAIESLEFFLTKEKPIFKEQTQ